MELWLLVSTALPAHSLSLQYLPEDVQREAPHTGLAAAAHRRMPHFACLGRQQEDVQQTVSAGWLGAPAYCQAAKYGVCMSQDLHCEAQALQFATKSILLEVSASHFALT